MIRGFPYVRQNHIILPKSFPKINTRKLVYLGYNLSYENNLSNRKCNFLSASKSFLFLPFLPLLPKHTHLQCGPHSGLPLPTPGPILYFYYHPISTPMFATSSPKFSPLPPHSSLLHSSHSPFIPLSPNPTPFLSVSVCISLCPQTSENQVILLEFCVLLCLS